jgi:cytidine deaminase
MARQVIPWAELFNAAIEARSHAYAPYSGFAVGAAVFVDGEQVASGCNVENSSYGVSVCAERNAIACAIARLGARKLLAVAIVSESAEPSPPCGVCLQVLAEFANGELPVYCRNLRGKEKRFKLRQLLPHPFTKTYL